MLGQWFKNKKDKSELVNEYEWPSFLNKINCFRSRYVNFCKLNISILKLILKTVAKNSLSSKGLEEYIRQWDAIPSLYLLHETTFRVPSCLGHFICKNTSIAKKKPSKEKPKYFITLEDDITQRDVDFYVSLPSVKEEYLET